MNPADAVLVAMVQAPPEPRYRRRRRLSRRERVLLSRGLDEAARLVSGQPDARSRDEWEASR